MCLYHGWPDVSDEIEIHSLAAFHGYCFSQQCLRLQRLATLISVTLDVRPTPFIIIWQEHYFQHSATCWWNKLPFELSCKHKEFASLLKIYY